MKKFSILALTLMLAFSFASCVSKQALKDQVNVSNAEKVVEVAKENDPKVVCKKDCDKKAEECVTKAGKDKKKAAACDKAKAKCAADCDAPKKEEPAKKKK